MKAVFQKKTYFSDGGVITAPMRGTQSGSSRVRTREGRETETKKPDRCFAARRRNMGRASDPVTSLS